jgi:hypothetical protein
MRIHSLIIAALYGAIQLWPASAGELIAPSEPVVRGSIRSALAHGQCLSVSIAEWRPGAHLEVRPCQNSADQIFDLNVLSFEIKIHELCVDALRSGDGDSQAGDPVGLWYCQGTPRQKWFPIRNNPHTPAFSIFGGGTPTGHLCLDIPNGSKSGGTQLTLAACTGDDNQLFRIHSWPALVSKAPAGIVDQWQDYPLP